MFGQLSNRESLRDVVLVTQAHASKAYHLGFGKQAAKSTLADAYTMRDYQSSNGCRTLSQQVEDRVVLQVDQATS